MSSLADRSNALQSRIESIDQEIARVDESFAELAREFTGVNGQASLRQAAALESKLVQLRQEKSLAMAAQAHVTQEQLNEKQQEADKARRATLAKAKEISGGVITLNDEIDQALVQLRQMLERRFGLLSELAATGAVDQAFVVKLQSRAGPTRACCWAGLAKFVSLEKVATQSWLALASVNPVLLGIGKDSAPQGDNVTLRTNGGGEPARKRLHTYGGGPDEVEP
jgi:hypothetical protein